MQGRRRCVPCVNASSTPQRTTFTFGQCACGIQRYSWLRPKELMAATKAASRTFSPRCRPAGMSNSSGPCTVKENGGPPSRAQHRHFRPVGAEVRVHVRGPFTPRELAQQAGLRR
jgi:hypothetical protein